MLYYCVYIFGCYSYVVNIISDINIDDISLFLEFFKMSLYLEYKVKTNQNDEITGISYHCHLGLLTVICCTPNDEVQILICDELVSIIIIFITHNNFIFIVSGW